MIRALARLAAWLLDWLAGPPQPDAEPWAQEEEWYWLDDD